MSMELRPEQIRPYLKLITEAIIHLSNNKGSLRKDIWDYLYNKYPDRVEYRDFLLAIRRFRNDGKMFNNDGIYSMHQFVLTEVRDKAPTPVFSNKPTDAKKANAFMPITTSSNKLRGVS